MNFKVSLNSADLHPEKSNLMFRGYMRHNGMLLFDGQAEAILQDILAESSLDKLLSEINGSFQLIYYQDNVLHFTIDHFGGQALFYKLTNGTLELFDDPMTFPHGSKLNDAALCAVLSAGYTIGAETVFQDVVECAPGTLYSFDCSTGKLDSKTWYHYYSSDESDFDPAELESLVQSLFPDTEQGQYTLSLSGGIDSRFLLGLLLRKETAFQTFSFGSESNFDRSLAAKLAAFFQFRHNDHRFDETLCRQYFTPEDIRFIIRNCTLGRSLPNETDLISSRLLNPATDIICKGFCGDGLAGSLLNDKVLKLSSLDGITNYLFEKYFDLTPLSGRTFKNTLRANLKTDLNRLLNKNKGSYVSTTEEWHLLHKQRKYVVNTLSFYKAAGYRFYLPFYDRRLMDFFANLKLSEKLHQKAYYNYLKEHIFTGKLAVLKEIPTSRKGFRHQVKPNLRQRITETLHHLSARYDPAKLRRRFSSLPLSLYADSFLLLTGKLQDASFLHKKVGANFPELVSVSAYLRDAGCSQASSHLVWLSRQSTAQLNLNGLALCRFFLNEQFSAMLAEHIT
ncbi:MAG: asparagine synthase-related protein [Candidatus Cloacimonadaceae bacterium]